MLKSSDCFLNRLAAVYPPSQAKQDHSQYMSAKHYPALQNLLIKDGDDLQFCLIQGNDKTAYSQGLPGQRRVIETKFDISLCPSRNQMPQQ